MIDLSDKIKEIASVIAEKHGQDLVDVELASNNRGKVIKILIGSVKGPTIKEITAVNREFSEIAEEQGEKLIPFEFQLEVSSPGLERPLTTIKDFNRNISRPVKVVYEIESENIAVEENEDVRPKTNTISGDIKEVNAEQNTVLISTTSMVKKTKKSKKVEVITEYIIDLIKIKKAKLEIKFK